jgi:hypothetical protein
MRLIAGVSLGVLGLGLALGLTGCAARGGGTDVGGTETGDGDGDTGELPAECLALLPEPAPATPITVTIRNDRSEPIYIDPRLGCASIPFWLLGPEGESRTWWSPACKCACELVMSDPNEGCQCSGPCEAPALERIEVGGSWTVEWDGLVFDSVALPGTCGANPELMTCDATRAAEAGEWTVAIGVWPEAEGCDDGECSCELALEHCKLYGSGVGELLELAIPFELPETSEVLVAID